MQSQGTVSLEVLSAYERRLLDAYERRLIPLDGALKSVSLHRNKTSVNQCHCPYISLILAPMFVFFSCVKCVFMNIAPPRYNLLHLRHTFASDKPTSEKALKQHEARLAHCRRSWFLCVPLACHCPAQALWIFACRQ